MLVIVTIIGFAVIGTTFAFAIPNQFDPMNEQNRNVIETAKCLEKWNEIVEIEQINKLQVLDPVDDTGLDKFTNFIEDGCLLSYQTWMPQTHPDWEYLKTLEEKLNE